MIEMSSLFNTKNHHQSITRPKGPTTATTTTTTTIIEPKSRLPSLTSSISVPSRLYRKPSSSKLSCRGQLNTNITTTKPVSQRRLIIADKTRPQSAAPSPTTCASPQNMRKQQLSTKFEPTKGFIHVNENTPITTITIKSSAQDLARQLAKCKYDFLVRLLIN